MREKRERAEKRAKNLRQQSIVLQASSGGRAVDGATRNLIPDETRKMSQRVAGFRRVLPG